MTSESDGAGFTFSAPLISCSPTASSFIPTALFSHCSTGMVLGLLGTLKLLEDLKHRDFNARNRLHRRWQSCAAIWGEVRKSRD